VTLTLTRPVAADPAHQLVLTPTSASTQPALLTPVVGSPSLLVVAAQQRRARDADEGAVAGIPSASGPVMLFARSATGELTALGPAPSNWRMTRFSLVGSVLTAGIGGGIDYVTRTVAVWRTTTGKRTSVTLRKGDWYLSSGPDGVVYSTPSGAVMLRTLGGHTTSLGHPFGTGRLAQAHFGAADADGVVVSANNLSRNISYIRFASPHTVTALDDPSGGPAPSTVSCQAVAGAYAACTEDDNSDLFPAVQEMLVPLDGSAATIGGEGCEDSHVALAGATLLWSCGSTLVSQAAGSDTDTASPGPLSGWLASAYGAAVADTADEDSIVQATSADHVSLLVHHQPSPVTVDAFALTAGKVLYTDDQPAASHPGAAEGAYRRSLTVKANRLRSSAARLVSRSSQPLTGNLVGASRDLDVYAAAGAGSDGAATGTATLHVVSATRSATISGVLFDAVMQVSGSDVLYQGRNLVIYVYDATTRKTTAVQRPGRLDRAATALAGHSIAYATRGGAIYRKSFLTSKRTRVAPPPKHPAWFDYSVFAHGSWVGWRETSEVPKAGSRSQLRNSVGRSATVTLHHSLYSLTSAGALLDARATFSAYTPTSPITSPTRFWLRTYAGHTTLLLDKRSFVAGPQIAGSVVAWAGPTGVLHAARLP
jgi:hypothetical protein